MFSAATWWGEAGRPASLRACDVLDTLSDPRFDAVTRLATRLFDTPFALVSLVDDRRQWFRSAGGCLPAGSQTDHMVAFCAHTVLTSDRALVVEDATLDPRFSDNPLVTGLPAIRFYAGAPLLDPQGRVLGSLCVLDTRARSFPARDVGALLDLAVGVSTTLELGRSVAALRESREHHHHTIELSRQILWTADPRGRPLDIGQRCLALLGRTREGMLGNGWTECVHPDDLPLVMRAWSRLMRTRQTASLECRLRLADGSHRWFRILAAPRRDRDGAVLRWYGTGEDIDDRKRAELALRESEDHHRHSVELSPQIPWTANARGRVEEVSPRLSALTGVSQEDMLARGWGQFTHPEDQPEAWRRWLRSARTGEPFSAEYRIRVADGSYRWFHVRAFARRAAGGGIMRWYGTAEDITGRKEDEARITHLALHDTLTGLGNRALYRERLEQELVRIGRGAQLAVLCVGLDNFKAVNDTFGHPAGDRLLREVAQRLVACVREIDVVSRFGGDEFVVIQTALDQPENAAALARRIIAVIGAPCEVDGRAVTLGATVGVALAPQDGADADRLFQNADMALFRAKAEDRGSCRFFEQGMHERLRAAQALRLDLRQALDHGELELAYQPLVDVGSLRITGFEALLRWRHPALGMVSPAVFIPLAEETGAIRRIGEWVLEQACREATGWPSEIRVAVNLSPVQFRDADLPERVAAILALTGLTPGRLELEITESVLLADSEANLVVLEAVHALGVRVAMDDFGTGYSSLCYLHRFAFDKLKIDQSFIGKLSETEESRAIVRAVLGLSRDLGLHSVAEGVETAGQLDLLREYGCNQVQGYHFSRPVTPAQVAALLDTPEAWAAGTTRALPRTIQRASPR